MTTKNNKETERTQRLQKVKQDTQDWLKNWLTTKAKQQGQWYKQ